MTWLLRYTYSNLYLRKSWSHIKQLLWGINRITANNCIVFGVTFLGWIAKALETLISLTMLKSLLEIGQDTTREKSLKRLTARILPNSRFSCCCTTSFRSKSVWLAVVVRPEEVDSGEYLPWLFLFFPWELDDDNRVEGNSDIFFFD